MVEAGTSLTYNNKQLSDIKKRKFCDYTVVNEKNKTILKEKLLSIISLYE